ncbi:MULTISPECIES: hypothetical protein [unclassified Brenneria]|uniref:hypothetical protein n=1 Tax=unclassified Brenneria TaxID=2634434 RepID=UPI0018F1075A|nr:hypothetical protein [Brenneria sp. L3-3C-1]MBJ7220955.1 hypothetical protein [Brenneria sp. L3-3C-1]MEE3642196.1 hypothetical protein [Brenneria sp. L3_3C_1]
MMLITMVNVNIGFMRATSCLLFKLIIFAAGGLNIRRISRVGGTTPLAVAAGRLVTSHEGNTNDSVSDVHPRNIVVVGYKVGKGRYGFFKRCGKTGECFSDDGIPGA